MPWKESCRVNERMRFVTRREAGERMSDLCREFGISRKTGHKIWDRYRQRGPEGLFDESRRPITCPHRTKESIQLLILEMKKNKPTWGADKLKEILQRRHPELQIPSRSAIYYFLSQRGLVKKKSKRIRTQAMGTRIPPSNASNEIWCTDFKGEFLLGNKDYCYPLTITDHFSRYVIACEGMEHPRTTPVKTAFEEVFENYGLPNAILSDNGSPFGSTGLFALSQLSLWWMRLGIQILRIVPGHPEQNGRHERMHLTLKQETTRPAGGNFLQQQERFDYFKKEFNYERPHESLQMKCPAELYTPSIRKLPKALPELVYPTHDLLRTVLNNGNVVLQGRNRFFLGQSFVGQPVGLREEESGLWRVSYATWDLGFFDEKEQRFKPFEYLKPSGV